MLVHVPLVRSVLACTVTGMPVGRVTVNPELAGVHSKIAGGGLNGCAPHYGGHAGEGRAPTRRPGKVIDCCGIMGKDSGCLCWGHCR